MVPKVVTLPGIGKQGTLVFCHIFYSSRTSLYMCYFQRWALAKININYILSVIQGELAKDKLRKKDLIFAILPHSFMHLSIYSAFIKYPLKIKCTKK